MNERLQRYRRQIESLGRLAADPGATPHERKAALRMRERLERLIDPQVARNSVLSAPPPDLCTSIPSNASIWANAIAKIGIAAQLGRCEHFYDIETFEYVLRFENADRDFRVSRHQLTRGTIENLVEWFSEFVANAKTRELAPC